MYYCIVCLPLDQLVQLCEVIKFEIREVDLK